MGRRVGGGGGVPISYTPPSIVGWTAWSDANTTTATPNFSGALTGGLAGTIASGDIVVVQAVITGATDGTMPTAPSGEGWTEITHVEETANTNIGMALFWKRWGAGLTDDTTPTFTVANGVCTATALVLRGCKPSGNPYATTEYNTNHGATNISNVTAQVPSVGFGSSKLAVAWWCTQIVASNFTASGTTGPGWTGGYEGSGYAATAGPDRAVAMSYNPNIPSTPGQPARTVTPNTTNQWCCACAVFTPL
jgi:hypothetical protein